MFPFLSLKNDVASPMCEEHQLIIFIHFCSTVILDLGRCRGRTQVSDSSCASDTVDVLLYVAGQVKVNNMFHIGDVQTASCYLNTQHRGWYYMCVVKSDIIYICIIISACMWSDLDFHWPLWPPEWGTFPIWTGSGPPLGLSGNGRHGYWCRRSPLGTGSPPRRPHLSWSPQTPESTSPCLVNGERRRHSSLVGDTAETKSGVW